ncbi:four helix bundle protein [Ekhidna sp.]
MRDFRNLEVWQEAHQIALKCYHISKSFPNEEKFGITSQLRRSALSIPTNIAEGCGRSGQLEFKRFCEIAMGSAAEVEYLLYFSSEIDLISKPDYNEINNELITLRKRLNALIQKLKVNV